MPFMSLHSSYVAVCAEIQEPHVYLQNSQVELSSLYLDVPTKSTLSLVNSTLLPTRFHWGKVSKPVRWAADRSLSNTAPCGPSGAPSRDFQPQSHSQSLHSAQKSSAPQRNSTTGQAFHGLVSSEPQSPQ